jgi:hypothetical protein
LTSLRQHLVLVRFDFNRRVDWGADRSCSPATEPCAVRFWPRQRHADTEPGPVWLDPIAFIGGIGPRAAIGPGLYALLPIIRNTVTGILGVDQNVRAAVAMGMTNGRFSGRLSAAGDDCDPHRR